MPSGYLIVVGFVSILAQSVLLRELSVASFGVDLIYTLALGIWLLCGACGSMICRKTGSPPIVWIHFLFLVLALSILLDVAFIRCARLFFSDVPGGYLPLHVQVGVVCVSLLPAGLLLGLLFQWTAKIYIAGTKSLATAYAIESMGGLAGGICATLLLKLGCQNFLIALLCALTAAASSIPAFGKSGSKWIRGAAVILFAALTAFAGRAAFLDTLMTSWTHKNLVVTRDTPYSRVTVTSREGQTSVFENDALLFNTEGTRTEEFVHMAALQHPSPKKVLVLGGGIDGTIRETLLHSPVSIDYVEQNPALVEAVLPHLPANIRNSLHAANVRILYRDPRKFLSRATRYDLILMGMPEPASGQANRFFTREFFQQCHSRLNVSGVMAFSLQSAENYWTPQLSRRMVSIYRAARSVFPEVVFIPGSTNVVIGSTGQLTKDPSVLGSRLQSRGIRARIVSAAFLRYVYTNDRFQEISQILAAGTAPVNTDERPICYQYTLMIWLLRFLPSNMFADYSPPDLGIGGKAAWFFALGLPFLLLTRADWRVRRVILTGTAGFAGMAMETVLLLHYQTKNGILFQDIGILLTGFMAGLAAGAFAVTRMKSPLSKSTGIVLLLAFAILDAIIGLMIDSGSSADLPFILGSLFATGFLVAGIFAYASLHNVSDQKSVVSPLYAADLVGGCLGSILATVVLAPLAGLSWTAYLILPFVLLSALLV